VTSPISGPITVVELRRYSLHPAQREVLVELFEERFIESQEELGMSLLGQFRDLDDPDSFVWLRGFAGMARREHGLTAFYGGPLWARHRDQANATIIDSDNVLLLRTPSAQAAVNVPERNPAAEDRASGVLAAVIAPVADGDHALQLFERELASAAVSGGGTLLGYFVSETSPNNFPRLPIREDVQVLVFLLGYPDLASLDAARHVRGDVARVLADEGQAPEILRLAPTPRSLLGGNSMPCPFGARFRPAARRSRS
jgi:NIPSNAP